MIQCATCLHALADDIDICPYCGADCDADRSEQIDETIAWKVVREVGMEIEARLIAGRLHADGIPAVVLSQVDSTRNFTIGALAVAKVFVPAQLCERADLLLRLPVPPGPPFDDDSSDHPVSDADE